MRFIIPYTRLFAREIQDISSFFHRPDPDKPEYYSPSGAIVENLYWCGALTEITRHHQMATAIRVADPTGGITFSIRPGDQEVHDAIADLNPPVFIALYAEPDLKKNTDGRFPGFVATAIMQVDKGVRDSWLLETADLMLHRLLLLSEQIHSGSPSKDRTGKMPADNRVTSDEILQMTEMITLALSPIPETKSEPVGTIIKPTDVYQVLLSLITDNDGPRGIAVSDLITLAKEVMIPEDTVLATVRTLIADDEIYQPAAGYVRIL
ncbi:MAG: hypothetical protein JXA44_10380 [Methanospirillaceae archaeon]|nr:hypothetical protein [Methanospirillaceae archaeon]